jgi:hypothetical protein
MKALPGDRWFGFSTIPNLVRNAAALADGEAAGEEFRRVLEVL